MQGEKRHRFSFTFIFGHRGKITLLPKGCVSPNVYIALVYIIWSINLFPIPKMTQAAWLLSILRIRIHNRQPVISKWVRT